MIRANADDIPDITAFLNGHVETSMFPLTNLQNHGFEGKHPRAPHFYISRSDGNITDTLSITNDGMVMPQLLSGNYQSAAKTLKNHSLMGIIGPKSQSRGLQSALGLNNAATTLDEDEPQFILPFERLHIPEGRGELAPLSAAPKDTILTWMTQYQTEALKTPESGARAEAETSYQTYIANNSHAVLMDGDTPLAMTGFNAQLPNIVQIGGVFTPTELRSHGLARRAVALHLAQARDNGATRATLFSVNPSAIKAYQALGFERIGDWTLLLFATKITL